MADAATFWARASPGRPGLCVSCLSGPGSRPMRRGKTDKWKILEQRETVMFSEAELLSCLTHLEAENKLMWRDGMATYVGSG